MGLQPIEEAKSSSRLVSPDLKQINSVHANNLRTNRYSSPNGIGIQDNNYDDERSVITKFFGKTIIFMTMFSLVFIGLFLTVFQLILFITINLSNNQRWRAVHKRLSSYLVYILMSPMICLIYYWSRAKIDIKVDNLKCIDECKKPFLAIVIINHSYELDFMTSLIMADQLGNFGACKCFSKDELKYLPIVGWNLWMADMIYVKRDWQKDRYKIGKMLDQLFDYEQTFLGIFAEGTRWTPEKNKLSIEFAKANGLEQLKYHLIPRTRGFAYTIRHLLRNKRINEKNFKILNVETVMRKVIRFSDFIEGKQLEADIYCEEVILDEELRDESIYSNCEEDCPKLAKLVFDIYKRKDDIIENYKANGNNFVVPKEGGKVPFKRPILPTLVWILGFCFTFGSLGYLAAAKFVSSTLFWSILFGYMTLCVVFLNRLDHESQATKPRIKVK